MFVVFLSLFQEKIATLLKLLLSPPQRLPLPPGPSSSDERGAEDKRTRLIEMLAKKDTYSFASIIIITIIIIIIIIITIIIITIIIS